MPVPVTVPRRREPAIEIGGSVGLVITRGFRDGGTRLRVRVEGEIDLATTATLTSALELARLDAVAAPTCTEIAVDLRPIRFLGAAGIAALVRAHGRCLREARVLYVVADQAEVTRPLLMTGLDRVLGLRGDPDSPGFPRGTGR